MNTMPTTTTTRPPAQRDFQYKLQFHGVGIDLALIILRNIALTIITLGIYSFWGKVRVRQFLWQNSEFHGQRFIYHGTGGELLIGYLKVIGIYLVGVGGTQAAMFLSPKFGGLATLAFAVALIVLIPYAIYMSQRYLYSRTSWRGIRLGMTREVKPFVGEFIKGYFLTILTLGFYAPIWQNRLYAIRTNNSYLGTMRVRYTGKDGEVFSIFLRSILLIIVTIGIYGFWYSAKVKRYRAHHTWIGSASIGAARGRLELTGGDYLGLVLLNLVCILFTGGLATPWVIANNMAFFLKRFSFVGNVDFTKVHQQVSEGNAAADGLAVALDVGFGV